ncbi:hypothetical protein SAMN05428981_11043 [Bacillus sp. OV194]|nr:hypothetical protein SAMN05428981_11043 [Bacillus sp. OV194]
MLYDEFIKAASKAGVDTGLPSYFQSIDDEALYPPAELADHVGVSAETIRGYCRQNELKSIGITHYRIPGIEAKRFMFKKIFKRIPIHIRNIVNHY